MQLVRGFSLIELMIVIAIMGILLAVAAPSYQNYTRRAHYTEIIQAAAPYKIGVEECYQTRGELNECHAGTAAIPAPFEEGHHLIHSIDVNAGVIHIIPNEQDGIHPEDDYLLTPETNTLGLNWHASGGGITQGYAR